MSHQKRHVIFNVLNAIKYKRLHAQIVILAIQIEYQDGFYEGLSYNCVYDGAGCSPVCSKCLSSSRQCLSCTSTQNRVLKDGRCICKDGFYQKLNQYTCLACDYTCKTCLSHPLRCVICADLRVKDVNGNCVCKSGYFEKEGVCQPCGKWCDICDNEKQCTKCSFQFYTIISGVCTCIDGYYQSPVTGQCLNCTQGCAKCTSGSACTDCKNTGYILQNGYCKCLEGQFDNGTSCQACNNRCATCSSLSNCDSCQNLPNIVLQQGNCVCKDGNYEESFLQCQPCNEKCSTCSSLSKCQTCIFPDKFIIDQTGMCFCKEGMYEVSTPQKNCLSCNEKCTKCTNKDTCTECRKNAGLTLNIDQMCVCKSNEYFDTIQYICKPCQKNCAQCTSLNACQKCINDIEYDYNPTKQSCDCKMGYYIDEFEDKEKQLCTKCHFTCKSCSYFNICTECLIPGSILDSAGSCQCPTGQFLNLTGTPKCDKCLPSCKTCNNSQTCSKCANDLEYNPIDIYGNCNCKKGYYQKDYLCYKCPEMCSECTNENQCTVCIQNIMKLSNGSCSCPDMYFYDQSKNQCTNCPKYCQQCTDSKTCTSCSDKDAFQIINNLCKCKTEGYFEKPDGSCTQCEYTCLSCENTSQCSKCKYDGTHPTATKFCTCGDGLNFDRVTNKCNTCLQGCKECDASLNCSECSDPISYELDVETKQCKCRVGYYKDNNSKCSKCSEMCSACQDDKDKCTACAFKDTTYLVNNKCICKEEKSYFDQKQKKCIKCNKFCSSCDDQETCNTCLDTIKYEYVQQTMQCRCAPNYYISFLDGLCIQCLKPNLIHENTFCVQSCPENYSQYQNYCVKECPFLYVSVNKICTRTYCDTKCKKCNSDNINCDNCIQGHYLMKDNSCQFCDMQIQYYNQQEKMCGTCDQACDKCLSNTAFDCLQCKFAKSERLDGQCVLQCDQGEYPFVIKNEKVCKTCFLQEGQCQQDKCSEGYYKDKGNVCIKCHSTCLECSGPKVNQCIVCRGQLYFESGKCLVCAYGFYLNQSKTCSECHYSCKECTGPEINQCKSCNTPLKYSQISGKCITKENYIVEVDQKEQADSIGCKFYFFNYKQKQFYKILIIGTSDNFEVCQEQINFSKQTSSVLKTTLVSSACFNAATGLIMQGIGIQSWIYIQNHQLLGNLKSSKKVISLGIIQNHLKISSYYNLITFFQSDDQNSDKYNFQEQEQSPAQVEQRRILQNNDKLIRQKLNDFNNLQYIQKPNLKQSTNIELINKTLLNLKYKIDFDQTLKLSYVQKCDLDLDQIVNVKQDNKRVLLETLEDDSETKENQQINERRYFQDRCLIQLMIIGSLHALIIIFFLISGKFTIAQKVLQFIKWNLIIRFYMLFSNFMIRAAIEEIWLFDFSNFKAIISFSEAMALLVFYFVLYVFAFKFLFTEDDFANETLRKNYSVLFIQLKVEYKLQRIYWILFEIKKIIIIIIQIMFQDNEVLQIQIIIGILSSFFLYLVILRPFNSLLIFVCCLLVEFVNIFFFVNLMLLFQDPSNISLSTKFIYFLFGYEGLICTLSLIQLFVKLIELIKAKRLQKIKEKQDSSQIQLMGFKIDVNIDQFLSKIPVKSFKGSTKLVLKAKFMEMEKR